MKTAPLRRVSSLRSETLPEGTDLRSTFHYIDISAVNGDGVIEIPDAAIEFESAPSRARKLAEAGDTVLSTVRTYLRAIAQVPDVEDRLVFSTGFAVLRSQHGHGRFLTYCCRSIPVVEAIVSRSAGVSYPAITPNELMGIEVPNPAFDEQRRIADFLDDRVSRIDRIIAARREQVALGVEFEYAVISALLDRQVLRSGTAPIRRFCAGIEQGSSPVAEDRTVEPGEVGVLKTSAVSRGRFIEGAHKAVVRTAADRRYRVENGDVIIVRGSGSADLVGDSAVVMLAADAPELYLSDLTYRLCGLRMLPEYVVLGIVSARGRYELGARVRQGTGPAKARGDDILEIPVPLADRSEQSTIVEHAAKHRSQVSSLNSRLTESIDLLTEYKSSLITAAVTGELDVTTASTSIPQR